jgi:membrane-associated phospholipid phosphatase
MKFVLEGIIGLVASITMIFAAYYLPRFVTGKNTKYYRPKTRIDGKIPFVSWTVIFYMALYIAVAVAPFVIVVSAGEQALVGWLILVGGFSAVSFLFYISFPTIYPREKAIKDLKNGAIFDKMVAFIYRHDDPPVGCLPSFHNGLAWLLFFFCVALSPTDLLSILGLGIFAVAVSLSTLFIKQHYIADVVASFFLTFILYLSVIL